MMNLVPSADGLGTIARMVEDGTLRPDVAAVYSLQDVAQAWKDMAGNLSAIRPEVAALYMDGNLSANAPGKAVRRKPHGKIVLRVA